MAKIRTSLKQLRDADVRYISLVDRAATRIPFRVLKRDEKENKMGIDLTKVFKTDDTAKPYVSALVVFAQKDEKVGKLVAEAIEKHGFKTDRVQKADSGQTLVFAQGDQPKDVTIVRLSDQMLVNVANLKTPGGWVGEMVKEYGFLPDLKATVAAMYDQAVEVSKSEQPQDDGAAMLVSFGEYLNQMVTLPTNCFKLDEALTEIVEKCECEDKPKDDAKDEAKKDDPKEVVTKESPEEKAKRLKDHPPAEMEPKDEDDDQKCPPDAVNKSDKSESAGKKAFVKVADKAKVVEKADMNETILAAIKDLTTKVEAVATEQTAQKKVLDEVVQKADTLSTKLATTVVAPPVDEDRPAADGSRMRTKKADDDPRTGNFDTAFLRRRR